VVPRAGSEPFPEITPVNLIDVHVLAKLRNELVPHLKARGIGTRTMYPPIHQQKAYGLSDGLAYQPHLAVGGKGKGKPPSSWIVHRIARAHGV